MKDKIVFETSKKVRILWIVVFLLLLGGTLLIAYLWEKEFYVQLILYVPLAVFLYLNSCEMYTLTDQAILVKQGLFSKNRIPWDNITSVITLSKGFRFSYTKPSGLKGFYVVNNIKEREEMQSIIEKRAHLNK